jgi:hypothetical protein
VVGATCAGVAVRRTVDSGGAAAHPGVAVVTTAGAATEAVTADTGLVSAAVSPSSRVHGRAQRECRALVAEPLLHLHRIAASREQQARAGVAESVQLNPSATACGMLDGDCLMSFLALAVLSSVGQAIVQAGRRTGSRTTSISKTWPYRLLVPLSGSLPESQPPLSRSFCAASLRRSAILSTP